jgi:hypothetical protein
MFFDFINIELKRLRQMSERFRARGVQNRMDFLSQLQTNGASLMHEHNVELWALQFWKASPELRLGIDFSSQLQLRSTSHANAWHVDDRLTTSLADAERQWEQLTSGHADDDNDDHWAAHYRESIAHTEKVLAALRSLGNPEQSSSVATSVASRYVPSGRRDELAMAH